MTYCTKCGTQLEDNAEFCSQCGTPVTSSDDVNKDTAEEQPLEDRVTEAAERFGKKAEHIGKRIEKKADDVGHRVNTWYDTTFKGAGPLIAAFLGLIVMRILIAIIQWSGDDIYILTAFSEALHDYLLIVFASMLISGYNTYLNRRYRQHYQWLYPLVAALGFIIGAWVAAHIMVFIDESDTIPVLGALGSFIYTYLVGIFILALVIGYGVQLARGPCTTPKKKG